MPECCKAEETAKCRFLFYDKTTGDVLDVGSGGGAGETLTGDAFVMWRFNSPDSPNTIGCIPYYFNKLGMKTKPAKLDLTKVADYEAKSRAWNAAKIAGNTAATHAAFEDM